VEGRPLDETQLVERAKHDDRNAYEVLVSNYQELAFRAAYLITRDAGEAEEAAQEAFVKAYFALGRFRPGAPFKPWLMRIVANEAYNRRADAGRRAGLQQRAAAFVTASGDPARSPEALAEANERRETLLHAMSELSVRDRTVLVYRYFLELSEQEMATALHCRPGTVKSRLFRSLARLRSILEREAVVHEGGARA
jgi:RNA polymerase sigma-70 factor (ECF subfamily)